MDNSEPNANSTLRRLSFFSRRPAMKSNEQESEQDASDVPATGAAEDPQSTTDANPADIQGEATLPAHHTTVLVVDEGGSIRKLDGPCPQQEFFSVSQSISWQQKIPNRLQVH